MEDAASHYDTTKDNLKTTTYLPHQKKKKDEKEKRKQKTASEMASHYSLMVHLLNC